MVDRLRTLLEDPHDPAVARALVLLACWSTIGLAVLVGLGGGGGADPASRAPVRSHAETATSARPGPSPAGSSAAGDLPGPRQDPQDRPGSPAARRARRELATHRALQHLPWRRDGLSIEMVGASGPRAVLEVWAPSLRAARAGYRLFLRRNHDDGRAYLPRFRAERGRG